MTSVLSKSCANKDCTQINPQALDQFCSAPTRRSGLTSWCKTCANESMKRSKRRLRIRVLEHLGDKCVKCGFDDERALQIDHIHGGGRRELQRLGGTYRVYKLVLKSDPGVKYQLLCANCNWIKRFEDELLVA